MKLIIDRIDEDLAVCETEEQTFVKIPLSLLPKEIKEGSILVFHDEDYELDYAQESIRRHEINELHTSLFEEEES